MPFTPLLLRYTSPPHLLSPSPPSQPLPRNPHCGVVFLLNHHPRPFYIVDTNPPSHSYVAIYSYLVLMLYHMHPWYLCYCITYL